MTVETIKDLIEHFPPDDQATLASWLGRRDMQAWDAQIERDFSEGGAGVAMQKEIDAVIDSGGSADFKVSRPRGLAG